MFVGGGASTSWHSKKIPNIKKTKLLNSTEKHDNRLKSLNLKSQFHSLFFIVRQTSWFLFIIIRLWSKRAFVTLNTMNTVFSHFFTFLQVIEHNCTVWQNTCCLLCVIRPYLAFPSKRSQIYFALLCCVHCSEEN